MQFDSLSSPSPARVLFTARSKCFVGVATWLALILCGLPTARAERGVPVPGQSPFDGPVRYAPTRNVDFVHMRVECDFNIEEESVTGRVTHFVKALTEEVKTVTLDAVHMTFFGVNDAKQNELVYRAFDDRIEIDLNPPLAPGKNMLFQVRYKAFPEQGLYFIKPIPEYPDRPLQIWTQGEPHEAQHWIPCFDSPSERVSTEVIANVPYPLEVLSNGILKQVMENEQNTDRRYHWVFEYQHVSYLLTMVAGEYAKIEEKWSGIPIESWYYPGDEERAARSFELTADMLEFFSERFGRYPFNAYRQVVVRDFVAGGMENTTATTLSDLTLHEAKDEPHTSSHGLVAHEIAHQWFGNIVTCRDWSDIWLNESFATFCEALYFEAALGRPEAQMERLQQAESYFHEDENNYRRPLSCHTYRDPMDMFDSHSYPKGARILEMLRQRLGDAAFNAALQKYLRQYRFQSVETNDFRRVVEDSTGQNLGRFFHDWIHRGGHPEIAVEHQYNSKTGQLEVTVEQTQAVNVLTPLYELHSSIAFYDTEGNRTVKPVKIRAAKHEFSFDVATRPAFVRFDPESILLMELKHEKSTAEWLTQLRLDKDTLGRVFAARALGEILKDTGDANVSAALIAASGTESFWGVRRELARALGMGRDEERARQLEKMLASDSDPRVRVAAAEGLGRMKLESSAPALEQALAQESDWVKAASLRAHHEIGGPESVGLALQALEITSHRGRVRRAALQILEDEEHTAALAKVIELAAPGAPRSIRRHAIQVLGDWGKGNAAAQQALLAQIDDPHRATRRAVYQALARHGGDEARKALEGRRDQERRRDMTEALNAAIARLDAPQTEDELKADLEELKKKQGELERRLQELEESR